MSVEIEKETGEVAPDLTPAPAEGAEDGEVHATETEDQDAAAGAAAEGDGDGDEDAAGLKGHKLAPEVQKAVDKRIGREVRKTHEAREKLTAAEQELTGLRERVEKLADAGLMRVAERTGLLPELLDKPTAELVGNYQDAKRSVKFYGDWLEDHAEDPEAVLKLEGKEYDRTAVRQQKRAWQGVLDEIGEDAPVALKELRGKTREILTLGMAAMKAGWKPGAKAPATQDAGKSGKILPTPPVKPTPRSTAARKPEGDGEGTPDFNAVNDTESLAETIRRLEKAKK